MHNKTPLFTILSSSLRYFADKQEQLTNHCKIAAAVVCILTTGCDSSNSDAIAMAPCSTGRIEADMSAALKDRATAASSDSTDPFYLPFSVMVERKDGRRYNFDWAGSTPQTSYESASTSKLISATIILRQVDKGYLSLSSRPQDYIDPGTWTISSADPLYAMTLAQLLSFTSGLETEPLCLNSDGRDAFGNPIPNYFEGCVSKIASDNSGKTVVPGSRFYYASTHLQVAGLMAIKARGVTSWQDLFNEFKTETGLFPTATYDLPSTVNPRLAGGMHWTAAEYVDFLKALNKGSLLSSTTMSQMVSDQTANIEIAFSPIRLKLGEDWHYGFGLWHECRNNPFNCTPGERVSSPGAYGAYPFWDRSKGYFGIVARQDKAGNFPAGIAIERFIQPKVETWAACQ